jgi:hypothetical protein
MAWHRAKGHQNVKRYLRLSTLRAGAGFSHFHDAEMLV